MGIERRRSSLTCLKVRPSLMATSFTWTFSTIFTETSEALLRRERERLLRLALNLASALPADGNPSSFGPVPAEESNVKGYWYKVYCRNQESLLLLKLLLLRESDTTLTVGPLNADPIVIYSAAYGEGTGRGAKASLFVYTHLWVNDTARFFCLGYMQGSAMELIVQQRPTTWHAVGESSGRMCATCNPRQPLADARAEQLKPTYEGSPSNSRTIPMYCDGRLTDVKHYNFGTDVALSAMSGSATLRRLFARARVENLTATSQVAMRLGDVAALLHLTVKPHHGVLGEGDIVTDDDGYVILYRLPAPIDGMLRPVESVEGRRVLIMQNEAAKKISVWTGNRVQVARPSSISYDTDFFLAMKTLSMFGA
ncbi:hypothetical protein KFL_001530090 [Klebsormidium nitens]|uniref:Uncharacterized protein n=1 Tax=Klebsormidium nitens TaxID=105231 RepID=A0A1Y1I493_KLENI|nr:hypothetical protein KFL_001530090 [Klebsormidium nitens]|eukprot:GAQ83567.1 hypothetical protein KFL_001530090 [Klebsormidium nitens]